MREQVLSIHVIHECIWVWLSGVTFDSYFNIGSDFTLRPQITILALIHGMVLRMEHKTDDSRSKDTEKRSSANKPAEPIHITCIRNLASKICFLECKLISYINQQLKVENRTSDGENKNVKSSGQIPLPWIWAFFH